jgi:PKD repeat protein
MKQHYFLLILLALALTACKKDPEACFSSSKSEFTVTFANCSLNATSFDWEFGDGATSIAENPTHTYATYGDYSVTLRVGNKKGTTATVTQTVSVSRPGNLTYTGTYFGSETCTPSGPAYYGVAVAPVVGTTTQATMSGLWDSNETVTAVITNNGLSFSIARQTVYPGYEMQSTSGTANADGSQLTLVYNVYQASNDSLVDQCTTTLTR